MHLSFSAAEKLTAGIVQIRGDGRGREASIRIGRRSSVRIRSYIPLLVLSAFLSIPPFARALDVTGQSRTYLMSSETADSTRQIPLYEYLNFKIDNSARDSVSFNMGGWYRHDLKNESYEGRSSEDLQYAYLSIKRWQGNAALDLGRVRVNEGVASMQIDGVHARTDLRGGITIAAYGGSPVETAFDTRRGDSVAGGRISEWIPGYLVIGVSYLDEKNNRKSFRREEAVDIWLRPIPQVEMQGMSSYNAMGHDWMQHNYYATFGPFYDLRLHGEYTKVDYRQYFASVSASAFAFPYIDPHEAMTAAGGSIDYAITGKLTAIADYKNFQYRIAGAANYSGGKIIFAGESFGMGVSGHRMAGATDRLKYDEMGIYVSQKIARADISLQLIHLAYKQEINGIKNTDSASAALGYASTPKTRIEADVEYDRTTDMRREVRAMAKFVYTFDAHYDSKVKSTSPEVKKAAPGGKP
jgi:hypothetical protein